MVQDVAFGDGFRSQTKIVVAHVFKSPPRDPDAPVLSRFVLSRTALVGLLMAAGAIGLFLFEYDGALARGEDQAAALAEAQTMAVTTVVLFQAFYLLNCRSLRDSIVVIVDQKNFGKIEAALGSCR